MAGWVGLQIKKKQLGIPFVFDMRGFWPDERKRRGALADQKPSISPCIPSSKTP